MAAVVTPSPLEQVPDSGPPTPVLFGEHVRVPGGGTGRVVGFYRTETPTVLVALAGGGTRQVLLDDLHGGRRPADEGLGTG